jgi:DNA-binding CsgD family transcriptional regulator
MISREESDVREPHPSRVQRRVNETVTKARRERLQVSQRQEQILRLVAAGLSDKEIAARLSVSPHTVRSHLQRLYRDRGFRNRSEAVVAWFRTRQAIR